ncbi:MAG: dephospho-CoA kinase [Gemmiger sp.]|nr:dephospho-CoA kinase [Gemmiger sp.]
MKIVGLTGRSGCGKSTVMARWAASGCAFADADALSREVLLPGSPCIAALKKRFGSDIVEKDGALRRRLLADRAFATPEGTKALSEITFPEICRRIRLQIEKAAGEGHDLFVVDGAVIVGTTFQQECDALVVVTAPYDESVRRICARDGIAPAMARRRLDAQTPEAVLCAAATRVIANDSTLAVLQHRADQALSALRGEEYESQKF